MRWHVADDAGVGIDELGAADAGICFVDGVREDTGGGEVWVLVLKLVGEVEGADAGADGHDAEFAGGGVHWLAVEGDPFFEEGLVVAETRRWEGMGPLEELGICGGRLLGRRGRGFTA